MTLLWLVAAAASACTFSSQKPEIILPSDDANDAGRMIDSRVPPPAAPSGGDSGGDATSAGNATALAGNGSSAAAGESRAGAPSGSGGTSGDTPSNADSGIDAGSEPPDDTAQVDASTAPNGEFPTDPVEAYACAAALTLCLIDFANYTGCVRMTAGPCGLPDGGVSIPSPECAQKLSECVQQHPDRAQECNEMLATCR